MLEKWMSDMGGLGELAGRLGLAPEQMQALLTEIGARIARGETDIAALAAAAAEHGVSADKLQEMMGQFGDPDAMMALFSGLFDQDGDGGPLNKLTGIAKGLFG